MPSDRTSQPMESGDCPSLVLDLFAGPGGWSEGLRMLGLSDLGIEWDASACATRAAAGHLTVRADVAQVPTAPFVGKVWGLIASPPCQDFSMAGKRAGRDGDRGQLIDEVPRWVDALRPRWVACEQVPPALEVWEEFAHLFRSWGYSAWCGILNAADYGVPQARRRAILLATLDGVASPPPPTHAESPMPTLFGDELERWVSMASALGWGATERPAPTIHAGKTGDGRVFGSAEHGSNQALRAEQQANRWVRRERSGDRSMEGFDPHAMPAQCLTSKSRSWEVWADRPATTVTGDPRLGAPGHHDEHHRQFDEANGAIKLTHREALILQSFRPDYPVQGSRTARFTQIGNAVPPLLAAHIIRHLTRTERAEVAA